MSRIVLDVVERTVAAWATTFLGLLLAANFDLTDVSAVKAAAIAAIPAALSVVKGAVGAVVGDPSTAGWLPRARG
ncbi:holin [Streptomyces sp. NPDC059385]|uniref:holin n=1 Tax=Streptomyces sp. NPDC059385 TaxID=3346817 RepID=UPI0036CE4493